MTADTVGGVWNYAVNLADVLGRHGTEVVLATMGRLATEDQRRQAQAVSNMYLVESCFALEWMENPWTDVARAGEWLMDLAVKWRPELIHLNGYCHGSLPWRVPKLVVAHSCVLSWWDAIRGTPLPDYLTAYAQQVSRGLDSANAVIAPTAGMLTELRRLYGWRGRGRVIWNGISPIAHNTPKQDFILTVGRFWDEAKNLVALKDISDRLPWPVYAVGDTNESARQSSSFSDHRNGIASLRYLGYLPAAEVLQWMARASIYALPARYEPFGLSVLEAAASGCALVLGDIASLRELWEGAAWFVSPGDRSELARVLNTLIADPNLRARLALQARERAQQFELSRMAHQYLEVYAQLPGQ